MPRTTKASLTKGCDPLQCPASYIFSDGIAVHEKFIVANSIKNMLQPSKQLSSKVFQNEGTCAKFYRRSEPGISQTCFRQSTSINLVGGLGAKCRATLSQRMIGSFWIARPEEFPEILSICSSGRMGFHSLAWVDFQFTRHLSFGEILPSVQAIDP